MLVRSSISARFGGIQMSKLKLRALPYAGVLVTIAALAGSYSGR